MKMGTKNTLEDLTNHLFAELERLGDESLTDEQLEREIERRMARREVRLDGYPRADPSAQRGFRVPEDGDRRLRKGEPEGLAQAARGRPPSQVRARDQVVAGARDGRVHGRERPGLHPGGQEKFEARFGFRPTPQQVSAYRTWAGTQSKAGRTHAQDWHRRPVGYERNSGKGYVLVKVREEPEKPGTKDNWEMKHVLVWERTRGLELPDGWIVLFCDGNSSNLDPANLKAVPRKLIGVMNAQDAPWCDRATCEAAVALALLRVGIAAVQNRPRRCGVCGREFVPDIRSSIRKGSAQRTCRECLDKGLRSRKDYGWRTCPVCGQSFHAGSPVALYCSKECRNRATREKRKGKE